MAQLSIGHRRAKARVWTHPQTLSDLSSWFLAASTRKISHHKFPGRPGNGKHVHLEIESSEAGENAREKRKWKHQGPKHGGGGPWRAFLHVNAKGSKLTKQRLVALSEEYRNLPNEEKALYIDVGKDAAFSRKCGNKAFGQKVPKIRFLSLPGSVGINGQSDTVIQHTPVEQAIIDANQEIRQLRRETVEREAAIDKELAAFENRPCNRKICEGFASAAPNDFHLVPGSCPILQCHYVGMNEGSKALSRNLLSLTSSWDHRHEMIMKPAPLERVPVLRNHCCEAGICVCHGQRSNVQHFHSKLRLYFFRTFGPKKKCNDTKDLIAGNLLLVLRPLHEGTSEMWFHIALQYLGSHWRPTLIRMNEVPNPHVALDAGVHALEVDFAVKAGHRILNVMTLYEVISSLDLSRPIEGHIMKFWMKNPMAPLGVLNLTRHMARALKPPEKVWLGSAAEQLRRLNHARQAKGARRGGRGRGPGAARGHRRPGSMR